jgi:hypothetical protein
MLRKSLDYQKMDAQMSCIRKSYREFDDIPQLYIEISDELNTKLQFIFNEFQGLDFYTNDLIGFSTFLHQEILKDCEDNKDQLIIFGKKGG